MKLHILSDLHIEFAEFNPPKTDADVVILAGDIHIGQKGFTWAKEKFRNQEVIYVIGNHEYYRNAIPKLTEELKILSHGTNIHILENFLNNFFILFYSFLSQNNLNNERLVSFF